MSANRIAGESDLHTRIASVLASIDVVLDGDDSLNETSAWLLADAVIRTLRMHEEHGRLRVTRYVTDWYKD